MPRFTPTKYDPLKDSDQGSDLKYEEMVAIQRERKALVLGVQAGDCLCGCGQTPKGKKAAFAMGHDARYRGKLIRAHLTTTPVVIVTDGRQRSTAADILAVEADALLGGSSFGKALEAAEERRDEANRRVVANAVGSHRLVKVGRWEYTGQVAAVYTTGSEEELEIEYVTKQGETKRVRVPASKTKEA